MLLAETLRFLVDPFASYLAIYHENHVDYSGSRILFHKKAVTIACREAESDDNPFLTS